MNLKILKEPKGFHVFYVNPQDLVTVADYKIHKKGHYADIKDFDYELYEKHIDKYGFPPSVADVGEIFPRINSEKPGIEIMPSQNLFNNMGEHYYMIMDYFGLDSFKRESCVNKRIIAQRQITQFLDQKFSPVLSRKSAFQKRIVDTIDSYISQPQNLFELSILGEDNVETHPYSSVQVRAAIHSEIVVGIDWILAIKLLGLYALDKRF